MTPHLRTGALLACLLLLLTACGFSAAPAPTATPAPTAAPIPTVALASASPVPARKFTVSLVTDVGGLHDRSFNDLTWSGIEADVRRYGYRAGVAQSRSEADYVQNLTTVAKRHPSLIVAVGSSMGVAVYQVAGAFPSQRFAIVDARPQSAPGQEVILNNVANIVFKEQDAGFAAGVLAGDIERARVGRAVHNTIGYLGAFSIAPINRYIAGYVAGARRVNPSVKIVGGYASSYADPRHGRAIGLAQIGKGADILFQVASETGTGYIRAAGAKHVYAIGVDANQSYLGPQVITSAVKRVDMAVKQVVHNLQRGVFRPGDNVFGAANGGTGLAPPSRVVPRTVLTEVQRYQAQIATGAVVPPVTVPAR